MAVSSVSIKVTDNSDKVLSEFNKKKALALEAIGIEAERYASYLAPVDTGNLRNSISHATDENSAYVGTNVEYAPYQELGTRLIPAANGGIGYLRPAVNDHISEYKSIVEDIMKS